VATRGGACIRDQPFGRRCRHPSRLLAGGHAMTPQQQWKQQLDLRRLKLRPVLCRCPVLESTLRRPSQTSTIRPTRTIRRAVRPIREAVASEPNCPPKMIGVLNNGSPCSVCRYATFGGGYSAGPLRRLPNAFWHQRDHLARGELISTKSYKKELYGHRVIKGLGACLKRPRLDIDLTSLDAVRFTKADLLLKTWDHDRQKLPGRIGSESKRA